MPFGLARTASLIRTARRQAANCLLFDNGDFLQGTPLSDITARPASGWTGRHPVIEVMNRLRYDAVNLGNHEFNFGIEALQETLSEATFPTLSANAVRQLADDPADDVTLLPGRIILKRTVTDSAGRRHRLRIGVIGLLPPQITTWDQFHLSGRLLSRDIVEAARAHVPRLRAGGADLVIALAHTGIESDEWVSGMENAALALAGVPGIDAILAGHSHEVFPVTETERARGIDHAAGCLAGVPTVMAGQRGSHLGVLDLCLQRQKDGRWIVQAHKSEARPVSAGPKRPPVDTDPTVSALVAPAHNATLNLTHKTVGRTQIALHSYLAQIQPDATSQIAAAAQSWALHDEISDLPDTGQPILSASAPFKGGGRAGPSHYTEVSPGPISVRNVADLYPFPNTLCAVHLTGAELEDWLERAASCFHRIVPGRRGQPLWNPAFPSHAFDTITGLCYEINLTEPPRYDPRGQRRPAGGKRIVNLTLDGNPLDPTDRFVVATNNYRAFGGGPYAHPGPARVSVSHTLVQELMARYLATRTISNADVKPNWRFVKLPVGTTAIFESGPGLRRFPEDIRRFGLRDLGDTDQGFARFELPL